MPLTILSVAYPFAPVRPDTAGGAEQVLRTLDCALVERGHRSVVLAQAGSNTAGELIAGPSAPGVLSDAKRAAVQEVWARTLRDALSRERFDLVHMHGIDFHAYLPPPGPPVLVTLHLPLGWYPPEALDPARPDTFLHCVSRTQGMGFDLPHLLPPIENGVAIPDGDLPEKADWALMLTRVCPEKGVHLALDAAKAAEMPLIVAGEVFPYEDHRRYFRDEVLPRLDADRRFVGPVGGARKADLLARAKCLVVASTVAETSSLVAREALAAGTPVVAFARGALPDAVDHGRTGFLVEDIASMAAAMRRADTLDPALCRAAARERFSADTMIARYLTLYGALAGARRTREGDAA